MAQRDIAPHHQRPALEVDSVRDRRLVLTSTLLILDVGFWAQFYVRNASGTFFPGWAVGVVPVLLVAAGCLSVYGIMAARPGKSRPNRWVIVLVQIVLGVAVFTASLLTVSFTVTSV